MIWQTKKIFLIAFASLTISMSMICSAVAQQIKQEVMSAADFARAGDEKGKAYAAVLDKVEGKVIICGNADTICDAETEYCLKCTKTTNSCQIMCTKTIEEFGVCITKNSISAEDLENSNFTKYWPDGRCKDSSETSGGFYYSSTKEYLVTLESTSFIKTVTTRIFTTSYTQADAFTGSDGKNYEIFLMNDSPTVQYGKNEGSEDFEGCEVLPVKIYNMQGCFFCPLAELIFSTANDVTIKSFAYFGNPFKPVIVIVFAIWLAFLVLQQVFSMTKQDAPKFLSTILKQGFKVLFAFFLLSYSGSLFRYFIVPILDGGLKMGTSIQTVYLPTPKNWEPTKPSTPQSHYNMVITTTQKVSTTDKKGEKANITADTLYTHIEIFLASLQARMAYLQAIGTTLFCVGSHEIITVFPSEMKQGLDKMLLGGILTVFGFILTIAFAFYFMDALLQLAVIGAMLPFMIAGWPLKATSQYASTGFKMLLNTFFVMFFTGFVVSVNIELINTALGYSQTQNNETFKGNSQTEGLQLIATAITDQNISLLTAVTSIGISGFLLLIFSCLLGFKFVAQVSPLASSLSAGGFKGGLAGKIGTMAASTAKGMAVKAATPVGKELADQYHAAGGVVGIVGKPVASVGGLVGKAVGGADQEGKSWKEKSTRGKIGAAIKGITSAPQRLAKKVHSVYRKPSSGS